MSRAFVLWTGGKDPYYALLRCRQAGMFPELLVTFIDEETDLVLSNHLPPELILEQASQIGVPLMKVRASILSYEQEVRNLFFDLRSEGITRAVFGDIARTDLRTWYEERLVDVDMRGIFPNWGLPELLLVERQIALMKSTIIRIDRTLSPAYLGRLLDGEFIEYLAEKGNDPSGESGDYDTFVTDGPLHKHPIILTHAERLATPESLTLDIDFWKVGLGKGSRE